MKKLSVLSTALLSLLLLTACGSGGYKSNDKSNDKSNGTEYATYKEALAANDFDAAHKIYNQMQSDYAKVLEESMGTNEFADKYGVDTNPWTVEAVKREILEKEAVFLATQGTEEANKRLVVLLNEDPVKGTARPEGQVLDNECSRDLASLDKLGYMDHGYEDYVDWCSHYNSMCTRVLDIAISLDNKDLAIILVNSIKPDPVIATKPTPNSKDYVIVTAHYTTQSKDAAKVKYEQKFGKLE